MRQFYLLLLLSTGSAAMVHARVHWLFYAGVGVPYGSVSASNYTDNFNYRSYDDFKLTPAGGISAIIPIGTHFTAEGGLQYTMKGFRGKEDLMRNNNNVPVDIQYDSRYHLHYVSLPLTFNWNFLRFKDHTFQFGAGMTYAFLLQGSWDSYSITNQGEPFGVKNIPIRKGFVQTSSTTNGTFNIFDTNLRLQLSYIWRSRFMIRLFHEHSLYSIYLRDPVNRTSAKLRYTGISLGIIIPKGGHR